jgi:hypothetical protein
MKPSRGPHAYRPVERPGLSTLVLMAFWNVCAWDRMDSGGLIHLPEVKASTGTPMRNASLSKSTS